MDIKLEGTADLKKRLRKLTPQMQTKAMDQAVRKSTGRVAKTARAKAPRIEGYLRRGIRTRKTPRRFLPRYAVQSQVYVKSQGVFKGSEGWSSPSAGTTKGGKARVNVFYWTFVEFGTRFKEARPFMRPAFASRGPVEAQLMKEEARAYIDRVDRNPRLIK